MRRVLSTPLVRRPVLLASLLAFAAVAPAGANDNASLQPAGWKAALTLPQVVDKNPDPKILEIDLEARIANVEIEPGTKVEAWTYNGGLPGPLIRLKVGDRLIVHFKNSLTQPTTVHWHGVRVPIQMDGVPGYSQPDVVPGGTFTYDFVVPDAGLYWYHPHVMSAAQVGFGLYGALLVDDPAEDARVGVADELVVVLSDIGIDDKGRLEDPESGGTTGMAFGREGNRVLVNGRTGTGTIQARPGAPQRWRIVNTAKSRYFSLDLDEQPFTQIGVDGGLQEYPVEMRGLVLGPGERADLVVYPAGKPGATLQFRSYVFNRGYGSIEFRPAEENLFAVALADLPAHTFDAAKFRSSLRGAIAPLEPAGATPVTVDFTIDQLSTGAFEYGINKVPFWKAKPFVAKEGELQVWTLTNTTPWSHPFHLHGFFFQVLDDKGVPVRPLAWKDTVDVPFKDSKKNVLKVLVKFDPGRPGNWMFHCHILDHADGGLMGTVRVGTPPPGTDVSPHPHPSPAATHHQHQHDASSR
jgi:FtsP/CotA-like multicopper oxidase with cupredoxin domain